MREKNHVSHALSKCTLFNETFYEDVGCRMMIIKVRIMKSNFHVGCAYSEKRRNETSWKLSIVGSNLP